MVLCSEGNVLRVEELPGGWFEYNNAFTTVTEFYGEPLADSDEDSVTTRPAEGMFLLECW